MGKHGERARLWPAVLGLVSVFLVVCGVISLAIINPGKPESVCRYSSQKVTLEITGPDCTPIMRMVTDNADDGHAWRSVPYTRGPQFSQLQKGKDIVRIYEAGDKPFAGSLSSFFQARRWLVEVPSATPAP